MKFTWPQTVLSLQPNLTDLFGAHLSPQAQIIPPTTPGYPAQLQQRWTDYHSPSYPLGAIKPATAEDVQHIVRIAAAHDIPFFATGGGHGVSDYHSFHGLSIDLSHFSSVVFDDDASHLTIGGAVKIQQLLEPLYNVGRELPLGSCKCVGVVGATLSGGIGGLQGRTGLMMDSLESVRVVVASGELVRASRSENADLFWGMRGAGSNFGIVTEATYRLPPISNGGMYMNADFLFPPSVNASFWEALKSYDYGMPDGLAINAIVVYNRVTNEPMLAVNAMFYGPQEEGEPHVQPWMSLGPSKVNISMVPADQIMDAAFFSAFGGDNGACTPNQHINIYTMALKKIEIPTFESFFAELVKFWEANPQFQGRWLMQRYSNHGPLRVGESDTAYGNRDAQLFMNFEGFYEDTNLDGPVDKFWKPARDRFVKSSGYEALRVYPNYARGDEGPAAWYGPGNVDRLVKLKQRYDPNALFSAMHAQPVQRSYFDEVWSANEVPRVSTALDRFKARRDRSPSYSAPIARE